MHSRSVASPCSDGNRPSESLIRMRRPISFFDSPCSKVHTLIDVTVFVEGLKATLCCAKQQPAFFFPLATVAQIFKNILNKCKYFYITKIKSKNNI